MKRLISILIIIAVLFTLCPAALAEDDVEALKKRIEELEAEIAEKDAIIAEKDAIISVLASSAANGTNHVVTKPPAPQTTLAPLYDVGPSPTDTDFLTIEEIKLVPLDNGRVRPDMKIRCLYPEGVLQLYPQSAEVFYNYLNNDGEIIASNSVVWHQLAYNICGWTRTNAFTVQHGDDSFDPNEVKAIMIMRYDMRTIIGGRVSWKNSWSFLSPVQFNVDKLEIE